MHEEEMATVASEILSILPQKDSAHVLALSGELGAGKTAFVKALARELGIPEHITSPTFVIMKSYKIPQHDWIKKLVHIDAYRIEDINEMKVLALDELYKEAGSIICIEWPERIEGLIPSDAFSIQIAIQKGEQRTVVYGD
jgi:tRNA threonylcarbamoyladenosine biosynthesis protein TsaE